MEVTKKKPLVFKGAASALVTPFRNREIDYQSFAKIIDYNIDNKIDALVVCGTTGEAPTLSFDEQCRAISFAVAHTDNRVPVIAGCGSNCTEKAKNLTKFASLEGASGILLITPYYNKATPGGMLRHFYSVAEVTDKPIIVYNVPSRTGCSLSPGLCSELAKIDNICGIKEASGSLTLVQQIINTCKDSLPVYSGNDDITLPILSVGGMGCISVFSNIFPNVAHDICDLWFRGDTEAAKNLHLRYLDLMNALFCEVNPIPIKTVLSHFGFCEEEFRLPLCKISDDNRKFLFDVLKNYNQL